MSTGGTINIKGHIHHSRPDEGKAQCRICLPGSGISSTSSKNGRPCREPKVLWDTPVSFLASLTNGHHSLVVGITVPVTTLCPCSKEISKKGAHNQRSIVSVKVTFRKFFWIEDLIRIVENSASSAVYSLLKRSDEKFITEKAYDKPHVCGGCRPERSPEAQLASEHNLV